MTFLFLILPTIILCVIFLGLVTIFSVRTINKTAGMRKAEIKTATLDYIHPLDALNLKDLTKSRIPELQIEAVDHETVQGFHFRATKGVTRKGTVIVFGGSDGGVWPRQAAHIALQGYDVYAISYFAAPGLHKYLIRVELKNFEKVIDYLKSVQADLSNLSIVAIGKGAELALILATRYPSQIHNLALFSPSCYSWQGMSNDLRNVEPSWLFGGEKLKFAKLRKYTFTESFKPMWDVMTKTPLQIRKFYEPVVNDPLASEPYLIPTNQIPATTKIMLLAGGDDQVWPSLEMARLLKEKLGDQAEIIEYPRAGNIFFGPTVLRNIALGGTYNDNFEALKDSDERVLKFLESNTELKEVESLSI